MVGQRDGRGPLGRIGGSWKAVSGPSVWLGLRDPRVIEQSVRKHCDFFSFQDLTSDFQFLNKLSWFFF